MWGFFLVCVMEAKAFFFSSPFTLHGAGRMSRHVRSSQGRRKLSGRRSKTHVRSRRPRVRLYRSSDDNMSEKLASVDKIIDDVNTKITTLNEFLTIFTLQPLDCVPRRSKAVVQFEAFLAAVQKFLDSLLNAYNDGYHVFSELLAWNEKAVTSGHDEPEILQNIQSIRRHLDDLLKPLRTQIKELSKLVKT